MKKLFALFVLATCCLTVMADDEYQEIQPKKLPHLAQRILPAYFPTQQVTHAEKAKSKLNVGYRVVLSDGTKIQFDKDGNWLDVDGNGSPIPMRIVPPALQNYLSLNCPEDIQVLRQTKDSKTYEYDLYLSDGQHLRFDTYFKRID